MALGTRDRHTDKDLLAPRGGGTAYALGREETLDPEDWEGFRRLAHEMVDRMIDCQRDIHGTPAWRPMPEEVERRFAEAIPATGAGARAAYQDFLELVLPYPTGLWHPRWWGWAGGTGTPLGMMAAMLGASMNSNPGNFNDSSTRVEAQLLDWMKSVMGFPADASGIITSGGSVANIVGLTVARDAMAGVDVINDGVAASDGRLVLYASTEVHSSVFKAAKVLGLGRDACASCPSTSAFVSGCLSSSISSRATAYSVRCRLRS